MRILLVHNRYQQRGGEDAVFDSESSLLEEAGHEVHRLVVANDEIVSIPDKLTALLNVASSRDGRQIIAESLKSVRPDIVHVHNTFPLLSPVVFEECNRWGVPVVYTLHNYRTVCSNGLLMRAGQTCTLCLPSSPGWGVVHRCYRGSLPGSVAVAHGISYHHRRGTWRRSVDQFLALTEFAKNLFVSAGLPESRILVKPNFAPEPALIEPRPLRTGFLYVGRLSSEKGVEVLIDAAQSSGVTIRIAGSGPIEEALRRRSGLNVEFLGRLDGAGVAAEMQRSKALVLPSLWFEGFPLVVAESFANSLPIVASDIGGLPEIVKSEVNGFTFGAGNVTALASLLKLIDEDERLAARLGCGARRSYEALYSPKIALAQLEGIYSKLLSTPLHEV